MRNRRGLISCADDIVRISESGSWENLKSKTEAELKILKDWFDSLLLI